MSNQQEGSLLCINSDDAIIYCPSCEVLDGLRQAGLITYPSPLLRQFLE
jgi:hypothetical protein